jgi:hypothetical protein
MMHLNDSFMDSRSSRAFAIGGQAQPDLTAMGRVVKFGWYLDGGARSSRPAHHLLGTAIQREPVPYTPRRATGAGSTFNWSHGLPTYFFNMGRAPSAGRWMMCSQPACGRHSVILHIGAFGTALAGDLSINDNGRRSGTT